MGSRTLWTIILAGFFIFFSLELVKKSIFAHQYYKTLSESNKTSEHFISAPRGVLYDRYGSLLVGNLRSSDTTVQRTYTSPEATAHLLGYMALPSSVDLKDYSCGVPIAPSQAVGKTGLEKYFECRLRGKPGSIFYEVDARGKIHQELARNEPREGENIQLSISLPLQEAAKKSFGTLKGAVMASVPSTGEVLLFYSSPTYNPSIFVQKDRSAYDAVVKNPDQPLFNRLSSGVYPPGSTIKPFIALAALQEGLITPEFEIEDTGIFKLGSSSFGNWYYLQYGKKEGSVNVKKAISRSNDIFFYQVGLKLGINRLAAWLHTFRLDDSDIKPYFAQAEGTIPDQKWKDRNLHEDWYLGDTVNMSIGQGYMLINPIQLHVGTTILAHGGSFCRFSFEKGAPKHCESLNIKKEHLDTVISGMRDTCSTGGTGYPFFDFSVNGKRIEVGCKTGTAESEHEKAQPHAWFMVFAPATNPEIALTVLVENGGEGSSVAAPIAKDILTTYFSHK